MKETNELNLPYEYNTRLTLKGRIKKFNWLIWIGCYLIYLLILSIINIVINKQFGFDAIDYIPFIFITTVLIHFLINDYHKHTGFMRYSAIIFWSILIITVVIETFIYEYKFMMWDDVWFIFLADSYTMDL